MFCYRSIVSNKQAFGQIFGLRRALAGWERAEAGTEDKVRENSKL